MKSLCLSIFNNQCRYWLFLFFILLNFSWKTAQAQSGTSMYDAFLIPGNGCGYSSYSDYQNNGYGFSNNYGQPSPDVWYRFTLSNAAVVSISLCNSNFDTYLHLLDGNGNLVAYNDDNGPLCSGRASSLYQSLGAGTYYIVVEGYSSYTGDFNLDFSINGSGTPSVGSGMYNPVYAGTFSVSGSYTDTRSNADACLGNNIGHVSNDIYYQFTLTAESEVTLSHCGSGFDTFMHLLDGSGAVIMTNDDEYLLSPCPGRESYIQMTLPAGTYYVVSEGYGSGTGNIVTNINVTLVSSGSAPVIAYASPGPFTVGTAISPISPSNTGGAVSSGGQSTTTLAGSGYAGSANGTGTGASFNNPLNAAVDAAGNVYVADAGNHSIRKISPSGVVTTVAGSGSPGSANGVATSASFQHPSFIAIDASGNLFVSDQQNHRIRKVTPGGVVTTFAGSGSIGSANGTGTSASFYYPMGLTFDASGNLYVADSYNNKIRKINPAGLVSDVAGSGSSGAVNGAAGSASFKHPMGLGFDAAGNLYVADRENYLVRKINTSGVVSTFAGSGVGGDANGIGTAATFNTTNNLVLDAEGNIYVSDHNNHRIRKITPTAEVSTLAGTATAGTVNGTGSVVRFNSPFGIARGGDGAIYVIENGPHLIRKMVLLKAYTISPALPAGLVFNDTDGTISGTATVAAPLTTYTVTAYNSVGSGSTTLSFVVNAALACVEASQDQNYITTYMPRESGLTTVASVIAASCDPTRVQTGIQYFDGLGRPLQTVQVKGSPDKKDVVVPVAYDEFGREAKKYLPYASTTNNGAYKADGLTKVIDYYTGQPAGQAVGFNTPFSETRFEASPLNRVLEQGAPGASWQIGSGHTIQTSYETNLTGEVNIWTVSGAGAAVTLPYNAGTLYKTVSKDENWTSGKTGTIEEFKDLEGHIVLKRVWESESVSLSTYYVYDDRDNLRYVLPPAVSVNSFTEADAVFLNYIYGYKYDGSNRLIKKKIPGKGWESIVYNQLDQVVATQDAMQTGNNFWTFTKYDGLGRVILTGEVTDTRDQAGLASYLAGAVSNWEVSNSSFAEGYTQNSWPQSWNKLYIVNYYDNYTFPNHPGSDYNYTATEVTMTMTKGLLTATKVRNLESGVMYWTVNYYNERGELRESVAQHHLDGTDRFVNAYKFTGELESSVRTHNSITVTNLAISNAYTYDHMGRKKQSWQRTGTGNANVLLSELEYSDTGQLLHKKLHGNLQDVAYSYNERGWLHSQSSALFSQSLRYANPQLGALPQYNGNISEQIYSASIGGTQYVTYVYDALNRLKDGNSSAGYSETGITYDKMGNLLSLNRSGKGSLSYSLYDGNQLKILSGYKNGTFGYNLNGNLESDGMRGVNIGYNYLNLPSSVTGSVNLSYTYDATGKKLRKQSSTTGTSDYVSGIHYENNVLKFIQTEEGRAIKSGNDYNYEYTLTDHLGNNRVTFDTFNGIANKVGEEDYYSFGLNESRQLNAGNKYLYNKKELQEELGQLDYGARFYDPVVGRFSTIDNRAEDYEDYSSYVYVGNNPIKRIDPDGNDWGDVVKGAVVAVIDNATGGAVNLRGRVSYNNPKDFNRGQDVGDVASIVIGGAEGYAGANVVAGGVVITVGSGGTATLVGAPVAAGGVAMVGHGVAMMSSGASNLSSQKGRVSEDKKFDGKNDTNNKTSRQAYRNAKDQNGVPRSQQPDKTTSVREKGTGKPLKQTEYTNSKGEKVQIRKDNPKTYPDGGKQGEHYNAGEAGKKLDQHHNY